MELPEDVLRIIREYSSPITRPDWKKIHKMKVFDLFIEIGYNYNMNPRPVLKKFIITRHDKYYFIFIFDYVTDIVSRNFLERYDLCL